MAFDSCLLSALVREISAIAAGGRIEKIYQPERDEIILQMRTHEGGKRLLINAGSNNPRMGFTEITKENPMQAPMFCMLLRKHLTGSLLSSVEQLEFDRVVKLTFNTRDEMGFDTQKFIVAELMGKYSNLIFLDADMKVLSSLKTVDFTTSSLRQVLPGMRYELPPSQNKIDPREVTLEGFLKILESFPQEKSADKFITSSYQGISTALSREILYRTTENIDTPLSICNAEDLFNNFKEIIGDIEKQTHDPTVIYENGIPVEYSFTDLTFYGSDLEHRKFDSISEALDSFFADRDRENRIKQRASDIFRILSNAEARLTKKIDSQQKELADCEMGERYKRLADLITANMYLLKRGDTFVEITDYENWNEEKQDFEKIAIELDERLSPAANSQRYYKLYNKTKTAKIELSKQIEISQNELVYINSVLDSLAKAETSVDLAEIRDELFSSGYASKMKGYAASKKQHKPIPYEFETTNGYRVLCGKNNYQNEYISHKIAEKSDYWFHAKNVPGSHVIMITNGEEPPEQDFTDACEIAAYYSKARGGQQIAVDYLLCKGLKKVPGAKPGFVVYNSNWSAYVTPSEQKILQMMVKK